MAKGITCDKCTQGGFQWRRARSGKWVLWDITSNEPHFVGCAGVAPTVEAVDEFNAKVEQSKQLLNEALAPEGLHLVPSLVMPGAYEIEEIRELDQADIEDFEIVKARASLAKMYAAPPAAPVTDKRIPDNFRRAQPGTPYTVKPVAPATGETKGEPRNIPCTKCSVPNRITYVDLVAGRSCAHCMND